MSESSKGISQGRWVTLFDGIAVAQGQDGAVRGITVTRSLKKYEDSRSPDQVGAARTSQRIVTVGTGMWRLSELRVLLVAMNSTMHLHILMLYPLRT